MIFEQYNLEILRLNAISHKKRTTYSGREIMFNSVFYSRRRNTFPINRLFFEKRN